MRMAPPGPTDAKAWLLGEFFGNPSLVVSTYLFLTALWSWWSFVRGTATTIATVFSQPAAPPTARSFKIGATMRLALGWVLLYGIASFVTQLWAGSRYSPGQGGGLMELLGWSALFGTIAVAGCLLLVPRVGPRNGDPHWVPLSGIFLGYAVGVAWALWAFSRKGGPTPGDWWVCPALSCIGVVGDAFRMRAKTLRSWAGKAATGSQP